MAWDYFNLLSRAKKAENRGDWEEAKSLWKQLGFEEDVKAIEFIQESIQKGDEFRAEVERLKATQMSETEIFDLANKKVYNK